MLRFDMISLFIIIIIIILFLWIIYNYNYLLISNYFQNWKLEFLTVFNFIHLNKKTCKYWNFEEKSTMKKEKKKKEKKRKLLVQQLK